LTLVWTIHHGHPWQIHYIPCASPAGYDVTSHKKIPRVTCQYITRYSILFLKYLWETCTKPNGYFGFLESLNAHVKKRNLLLTFIICSSILYQMNTELTTLSAKWLLHPDFSQISWEVDVVFHRLKGTWHDGFLFYF